MAYVVTNPPARIGGTLGGKSQWQYVSADAKATVVAAAYISNALELGMKVGDTVLVFDTATPQLSHMGVLTFTGSAANLGFVANA